MRRDTTVMALPDTSPILQIILLAGAIGILLLFWTVSAQSVDQAVLWECSGYTGDAQVCCVNGFVEIQREEIAKLKG